MMKDAINYTGDRTIRVNPLVIPALNKLRNYPLEDLRGDLASTFVENLLMLE